MDPPGTEFFVSREPTRMNFYSDEPFCAALAASYFPNQVLRQSLFQIKGQIWKIPALEDNQPITNFPQASSFIDFYSPLSPSALGQIVEPQQASEFAQALHYLPRACHGLVTTEQWKTEALEQSHEPAPTVLWSTVESWSEYHQAHKKLFADINRRHRKLEREVGPVSFQFDDPDPAVLQACMDFKSQQYCSTGEVDMFAFPEHVTLFHEMAKQGLIKVSSLRVGDRLIAANVCATDQQRLYYWIPAYDQAFRHHSPGMLLLGFLLEESYKRGDQEFDFLIGGESYKWKFATHARLIAEIGSPPLPQQLLRAIKQLAKPVFLSMVNRSPKLKSQLKAVAQKLGTP